MPEVRIPPAMQGPTQGQDRVAVEGSTLLECLRAVEVKFPGFLPQVLDAKDQMHRFVQVFVNGDEIARSAVDTPVRPDDRVEILAAIGGG